jgi:pimeloyl-ACP methyl ester carboxylesterase
MTSERAAALLAEHRASGRSFIADGIGSFVLDAGPRDGQPVVCVHGVPTSSYLYRKVVAALAQRGLRGIAVDLPGLGLAERPVEADYSWSGLGRWLSSALDALGLDGIHLVVHDIGGPIGLELAAAEPGRIRSLTVLNTFVAVATFRRPWFMEPLAHPSIRSAWLGSLRLPGAFVALARYFGVSRHVPAAELSCYVPLLFGDDGGAAFLKIMRGFERTAAAQRRYAGALRDTAYPVQIVWGVRDPTLPWRVHGVQAALAAGVDQPVLLPGKHFVQEDCAPEIADAVAQTVTAADGD